MKNMYNARVIAIVFLTLLAAPAIAGPGKQTPPAAQASVVDTLAQQSALTPE